MTPHDAIGIALTLGSRANCGGCAVRGVYPAARLEPEDAMRVSSASRDAIPLLIWLSLIATPAQAGDRHGVMFGLAVGPSNRFVEVESPPYDQFMYVLDPTTGNINVVERKGSGTSRTNAASLSLHLQLGYGFGPRMQAYLVQASELQVGSSYYGTQVSEVERIRAIGADYHPGRSAPGPWLLSAAVGRSQVGGPSGGWAWVLAGGRDLGAAGQFRVTLTHSHHLEDGWARSGYTVAALLGLLWG